MSASAARAKTPESLEMNRRIVLPYKVLDFDSNRMRIRVENPLPARIWLFYSDVWHPFWKARVNDKPVKVSKANLAYKAVPLEPGRNHVEFSFHNAMLKCIFLVIGLNSLLWVVIVPCLVVRHCGLRIFSRRIWSSTSRIVKFDFKPTISA